MIVIFGPGCIGRTVLGVLLQEIDQIVFVHRDPMPIEALRKLGKYIVRLLPLDATEPESQAVVKGFSCLASTTESAQLRELLANPEVRIITTSVRLENLSDVACVLGEGLALRRDCGVSSPLILVCENVFKSGEHFRGLVEGFYPGVTEDGFYPNIVVDCIVPAQPIGDGMYRESYCSLKVGGEGLRTFEGFERIPNFSVVEDYDAWWLRKFWTLNTLHLVIALIGVERNQDLVAEVLELEECRLFIEQAMREIAQATSITTGFALDELESDLERNLKRFRNPMLRDPNQRIARNLERKLQPDERLVKPALTLLEQGIFPRALAQAIVLAVRQIIKTGEGSFSSAEAVVNECCRLPKEAERLRHKLLALLNDLDPTESLE